MSDRGFLKGVAIGKPKITGFPITEKWSQDYPQRLQYTTFAIFLMRWGRVLSIIKVAGVSMPVLNSVSPATTPAIAC